MTARRTVEVRRNTPGNGPQMPVERRTPPSEGVGVGGAFGHGSSPRYEQLALILPKQRQPEQRPSLAPLPPLPAHPTKAERQRREAMCGCRDCGRWFADEPAWTVHRHAGRCLDPAAAGLALTDHDHPTWSRKADP